MKRYDPLQPNAIAMAVAIETVLDNLCDDPSNCRERLLHTAGVLFAERGKDAVSTRELTKAAGVNLSAIAYYFGGKDGLYRELINHTIEGAQKLLGGAENVLRDDVARANGDRVALARAAVRFVHSLLTGLLTLGPEHWPKRLIMREIDHPTGAFARLYEAIFAPLNDSFRDLVAAATGRDHHAEETIILSSALLGECLIFHRNRAIILRALDWSDYSDEAIERIVVVVTRGLLAALDLPNPEE